MGVDPGKPIQLGAALKYAALDPDNKGGPSYGHYLELDPVFATLKDTADAAVAGLWSNDNWDMFRAAWRVPGPLPADCPQPVTDVSESYQTIPMRDGAEIEIKIMTSTKNENKNTSTERQGNVCVLRMHGGGWAFGWHGSEAVENLHAANHPNVVLVSIDYRLAPEHRYPTPLNDCVDTLKWVKANAASLNINAEKIVLLGDSSGSNLYLALALKARDENISGIIAMMLDWPNGCHPMFHQKPRDEQGFELESFVQNHNASVIDANVLEFCWDAYVPDAQPDPYHSPLLADSFKGLPPAFIQIAGYDPIRDEGLAISEKLKKDGVATETHVYKGLPHCFSILFGDLHQSKQFQEQQNTFLAKTVKAANEGKPE
ncbi:hypothetical protein SCUCBS95973_008368 [Sporothrix curviconia]|uniref:Alpha/beta hydrolase fold-3 domain-containing protein n=1 Tax=Sporothrix curviconia TaxID=1260050 RepID=A0ABP0CMG4_9PEZI